MMGYARMLRPEFGGAMERIVREREATGGSGFSLQHMTFFDTWQWNHKHCNAVQFDFNRVAV